MSDEFDNQELQHFEEFIVNIIKKGNKPYNRDPRNWAKRMSVHSLSRKEKIKYFLFK